MVPTCNMLMRVSLIAEARVVSLRLTLELFYLVSCVCFGVCYCDVWLNKIAQKNKNKIKIIYA